MQTDPIRKQALDGILVACVADARKQDLLPPEPGIETPSATRAAMFRDLMPLDRLIAYSGRAQQADPNDLNAWLGEVEARLAKGYPADLDAAQTALDRALELAPDNPDVHNALGRLLYQRSRFTKSREDAQRARAAFERALELDPTTKPRGPTSRTSSWISPNTVHLAQSNGVRGCKLWHRLSSL